MLTAMLSVDNLLHGASHDVWAVNVEEDYHEEHSPAAERDEAATGRSAPVVPRRSRSADQSAN